MMLYLEPGGRDFAKQVILRWLEETGGSNLKVLETATGLPERLVSFLLAELMTEGRVKLDKAVFKVKA